MDSAGFRWPHPRLVLRLRPCCPLSMPPAELLAVSEQFVCQCFRILDCLFCNQLRPRSSRHHSPFYLSLEPPDGGKA